MAVESLNATFFCKSWWFFSCWAMCCSLLLPIRSPSCSSCFSPKDLCFSMRCWSYVDDKLIIFWSYVDHMLIICWSYVDHMMIICWSYVDHMLIIWYVLLIILLRFMFWYFSSFYSLTPLDQAAPWVDQLWSGSKAQVSITKGKRFDHEMIQY